MLQSLKGKVAWITGAGSGIGEGAAIALADAGMTVVLSGRRADKLATWHRKPEARYCRWMLPTSLQYAKRLKPSSRGTAALMCWFPAPV